MFAGRYLNLKLVPLAWMDDSIYTPILGQARFAPEQLAQSRQERTISSIQTLGADLDVMAAVLNVMKAQERPFGSLEQSMSDCI